MSTAAESMDGPTDNRFEFGQNWSQFLSTVDDRRIADAQDSILKLLKRDSLQGLSFLDAGSGSGLFSLAASRLGAAVTSFDFDPASVSCTKAMKERFGSASESWKVLQGSLTDADFLRGLGQFDVVYCWGVAHHTGQMWQCIENLLPCVKPGGSIVLAIYNDQLYISKIWYGIKRIYLRLPRFLRPMYVAAIGSYWFAKRLIVTLLACGLRLITLRNPFVPLLNWIHEGRSRGMHAWYDLVDWVGGWPFEVARPEAIFRFLRDHGFALTELTTSFGHGCNEFVFIRTTLGNVASEPKSEEKTNHRDTEAQR